MGNGCQRAAVLAIWRLFPLMDFISLEIVTIRKKLKISIGNEKNFRHRVRRFARQI